MKSGCVSALSLWCPFSSLSLCRPLPFSLLIFIYIKKIFVFFLFWPFFSALVCFTADLSTFRRSTWPAGRIAAIPAGPALKCRNAACSSCGLSLAAIRRKVSSVGGQLTMTSGVATSSSPRRPEGLTPLHPPIYFPSNCNNLLQNYYSHYCW